MRAEKDILGDIERLACEPGFAHVVANLCFRDNFVGYFNELTADEYAKLFSWSRLIRTEISTLIGFMIKGNIEIRVSDAAKISEAVQKVDNLFRELHDRINADFLPDFRADIRGEIDDPFASARGMREPIFYGGESAYSFQYRDFAPRRYANDRNWLINHAGFDADEAKIIIQSIHDMCQSKLDLFIHRMRINSTFDPDILEVFSFDMEGLIENSGMSETKINSFLNKYAVGARSNAEFRELSDFNESDARPLIRIGKGFLCFQYVSLVEASYDSPSFWLRDDKNYNDAAAKHRGEFLEDFCFSRLKNVVGEQNVFRNVRIVSGRKEVGEIDILAIYFDRLIVIQAKSKKLTISARKGNDGQLKDDFKKAIQRAADQCQLCCSLLLSVGYKLINHNGDELSIPPNIKEIFPISLISDHYPALSLQTRTFLEFKPDTITKQILVIDIFALDVICEMLDTPLRFLSYLQLRAKIGLQISMSHELTALAFHLRNNLWTQGFDFIHVEDDICAPLDIAMAARRDGVKGQKTPEGILTELKGTRAAGLIDHVEGTKNKSLFEFGLMLTRLRTSSAIEIGNYIEHLSNRTAPDAQRDLTVWKQEDDSGVTMHCNDLPMAEACELLERHCIRRKYTQRASAWFGVLVEPLSGSIRQGITLSYPWVENDELNAITASMPSPLPMRNVARQLKRQKKVGRNEKCLCGSGLKYKRCCG